MNADHAYKQAAALLEQLPERLLAHADFDRVATALSEGAEATIDGVWGSSCALAVAALLHRTAAPMLVLVPQLKQVDALVDDLVQREGTALPRARYFAEGDRRRGELRRVGAMPSPGVSLIHI